MSLKTWEYSHNQKRQLLDSSAEVSVEAKLEGQCCT